MKQLKERKTSMANCEEKLVKMLKYVSEHNDFYKKRIKEYGISDPLDITQWPVLTRKELQENRYNMFSDGYKSKYFNQQLRRQSSSGSSGTPVSVYWDYRDYSVSMIALWRKRKYYYNISPSDKVVKFTMFDVSSVHSDNDNLDYYFESPSILNISRQSLDCPEKFKLLFDLLNRYCPKWIYTQPSMLERLMYYYNYFNAELPDSIKYIEVVGEVLNNSLKSMANRFFCVPIVNMYGSEEMNGIAYEHTDHHMHIVDDNAFVEVKSDKQISVIGEGEAYITNLNNHAMPLIRYDQGDIINISNLDGNCSGVNDSQIMQVIYGRKHKRFYVGEQEINSLLLTSIISEVNNIYFNMILDYTYKYITYSNTLICFFDIGEGNQAWLNALCTQIKQCFCSHIPKNTDIKFEVVPCKIEQEKTKREILTIEEKQL